MLIILFFSIDCISSRLKKKRFPDTWHLITITIRFILYLFSNALPEHNFTSHRESAFTIFSLVVEHIRHEKT